MIAPHDRPFAANIGYNYMIMRQRLPSLVIMVLSCLLSCLAYLFWHNSKRIGMLMLILGLAIAWARIYLGVHWPIDMVSAFIVALLSYCDKPNTLVTRREKVTKKHHQLYQLCFAYPIRKGWTKA